ncbi:hypothetical protein [Chromobacterium sp. Beijing]|uniref:hypothetical protein n=1 Tax=Chromobacterium sp. Beijing TaxID=2735795 RepID=UPI001F2B1B79|nr:hypothetical protein [Chromobacterium sp. Beijing]
MSSLGFAWVAWGGLVPAISDRIGRKPAMVAFSLIAACCPLVLLNVDRMVWLLPLVFLTYTGLGCFTLFMATIPAETVSPRRIATALGMIMGWASWRAVLSRPRWPASPRTATACPS